MELLHQARASVSSSVQAVLQSDPSKYFAKPPPGGAGDSMADQALETQRGIDATLQSSRTGKSAREVQIEQVA